MLSTDKRLQVHTKTNKIDIKVGVIIKNSNFMKQRIFSLNLLALATQCLFIEYVMDNALALFLWKEFVESCCSRNIADALGALAETPP